MLLLRRRFPPPTGRLRRLRRSEAKFRQREVEQSVTIRVEISGAEFEDQVVRVDAGGGGQPSRVEAAADAVGRLEEMKSKVAVAKSPRCVGPGKSAPDDGYVETAY